MAVTSPVASRRTRPYPVGSATSAVSTVTAAPDSPWCGHQLAQRGRREERHVAVGDDHCPGGRRPAHSGRTRRHDRCRLTRPGPRRPRRGSTSSTCAATWSRPCRTTTTTVRARAARRGHRVAEQGTTADPVQHLRGRGTHPRALTRGEDDDGRGTAGGHARASCGWRSRPDTRIVTGASASRLAPPDSNRDLKAPKACVLPLHQGGPRGPPAAPGVPHRPPSRRARCAGRPGPPCGRSLRWRSRRRVTPRTAPTPEDHHAPDRSTGAGALSAHRTRPAPTPPARPTRTPARRTRAEERGGAAGPRPVHRRPLPRPRRRRPRRVGLGAGWRDVAPRGRVLRGRPATASRSASTGTSPTARSGRTGR